MNLKLNINSNLSLNKSQKSAPKIYVIHENAEWVVPLRKAFARQNPAYDEWFINHGSIDLSSIPLEGVFYNRMSASSHTREHRYAVELTGPLLAWLQAHGRRVINDRRAMQLEIRKFEQYISLKQFDLNVPQTIAAVGKDEILQAAHTFAPNSFILKPNRGGKGLGVQLFHTIEGLADYLSTDSVVSLDGVVLVQEYVKPADSHIVRMEFIGGKFHYAVRVDTSEGFELCPADTCQVGDAFCPTDSQEEATSKKAKFEILKNYKNPDIPNCERFLKANGMEVAAIEYVENEKGERLIYDININTNYNSEAEKVHGQIAGGMERIAAFLGEELVKLQVSK
jgi:glutathione synthase/RimK-type ligase-like ATP-grasp enzyme